VRLAALNLLEISEDGSGGSGLDLGIPGIIKVSPKFTCSRFLLKCHLSV